MLRHHGARSHTAKGLSRSKSSASVRTTASSIDGLEHIDPATAKRDAQIAAQLSFSRAFARGAGTGADKPGKMLLAGSSTCQENVPPSRGGGGVRLESTCSTTSSPELQRRQSIRFAGNIFNPNMKHTATQSLVCSTGSTLLPSHTNTSKRRLSTLNCQTRATTIDDGLCIGQQSNENSDCRPVSELRLRKARSLYVDPGERTSSYFFSNEHSPTATTLAPNFDRTKENRPLSVNAVGLRARQSMSFFDSHAWRMAGQEENDNAIRAAEDTFRAQIQRQRQSSSRSILFRRSSCHVEPVTAGPLKRKTMRRTDRGGDASPAVAQTREGAIHQQTGNKARVVSKGFRNKIKSIFQRAKAEEDEPLDGVTGLASSRQSQLQGTNNDSTLQHGMDGASLLQPGPSRMAEVREIPDEEQLRSSHGSLSSAWEEGQKDENGEQNVRILSWTTSGVDSITSRGPILPGPSDYGQHRLPIIRETGHRDPSPWAHGSRATSTQHASHTQERPTMPTIDSQRVYSALMRRLDETERGQGGISSTRDLGEYAQPPLRGSSIDRCAPRAPSTIRCVGDAGAEVSSERTESTVAPRDRVTSVSTTCTVLKHGTEPGGEDAAHFFNTNGQQQSRSGSDTPRSSHYLGPPRPLSIRNSAFFSSPDTHLFRTKSPYRRALQEKMRATHGDENVEARRMTSYLASNVSLPQRCQSTRPSERDERLDYTESVYSEVSVDDSTVDDGPLSRPSPSIGSAIGAKWLNKLRTSSRQRTLSTASSVEWKTQLAADVQRREGATSLTRRQMSSANPGHVKEETIINDENEQHGSLRSKLHWPPGFLTGLSRSRNSSAKSKSTGLPTSARDDETQRRLENPIPRASVVVPNDIPPSVVLTGSPQMRLSDSLGGSLRSRRPTNCSSIMTNDRHDRSHAPPSGSLLRQRSINTPASPIPSRLRTGVSSLASSPGLTAAVEKRFGVIGGRDFSLENLPPSAIPTPRSSSSRARSKRHSGGVGTEGGGEHAGPATPHRSPVTPLRGSARTYGSQEMVDAFLSSRRRRIAAESDESDVFL